MSPVVLSASFFINAESLNLNLAPALNADLQMPEGEILPASAPDGGSSLLLGPFSGYAPALVLAGVSFTINPAENFPNAPDPQEWTYTENGELVSGAGYWELESVPEPSPLALSLFGLSSIGWMIRRSKRTLV